MTLGFPGEGAGRTRRWLSPSAAAEPRSEIQHILHALLERSRGAARAELESLAREQDPQFFYEGLMAFGLRQEQAGNVEFAAEVYAAAVGAVRERPLQVRAQQQLDAILGRGAFGPRFEFLARHFAREASDPTMLLAMTAGSAVFSLSRGAFLSRLLAAPTRSFLTQGLGARALASSGAFLLEVPAFWATGKGLRELVAPGSQHWDAATNFRELAGAGLTLGALKLTGFGANSAYRGVAGPVRAVRERPLQALFAQTGMFTGILLGHRLEEMTGLRRPVDGATTFIDSLVMLLQFNVGGRLSHTLMGASWAGRVREMEYRLDQLEPRNRLPRPPLDLGTGLIPALAGSGIELGGRRGASLESLVSRPNFMVMEGEGGSRSPQANGLRTFLLEVANRGKTREVSRLRDLLREILNDGNVRSFTPLIQEKFLSRDHEDWRSALRILGEFLEKDQRLVQHLDASAILGEFTADWTSRPHFTSPNQVEIRFPTRLPKAYSIQQRFVPDLQRALAESPNLKGWEEFCRSARIRKDVSQTQIFRGTDGAARGYGNGKNFGLRINFDPRGNLLLPIEIRSPYSEVEWAGLSNPEPPPPAVAEAPRLASHEFGPLTGENPSGWALRLLEASREGEANSLEIARSLEARLRDPVTAGQAHEVVERMVSLTDGRAEGTGILARRFRIPGLRDPLTIVSLPTTFLPEQWSRVFAEGVVEEFRRDHRPVDRAIEIGSGTGWVSILAAKLGMAREVIGVDRNPHAQVVGRLNAALNGVEGVSFLTGDLLTDLPAGMTADLILACLPQVPQNGGVESLRSVADYYPSEGKYWDRYGLGLIDRALGQARERLNENGRVLFNLGGRPGRPILEELLARRGFHPSVRYAQLIQQDPTTDFSALARLESSTGHRFEFFLKQDPNTPISAAEAAGHSEVYHMLYLTEGRPYAGLIRNALEAETTTPPRLGYTQDPGSENESLRAQLALELSTQWGAKLPPELLFIGPSSDLLLEGLLRVALPDHGRVLYSGPADQAPPAGLRGFNAVPLRLDIAQLRATLEELGPEALVLRLSREHWNDASGIQELIATAVRRQSHVVILEDHPAPSQGGAHPAAAYLSSHPEATPYLHLIQSLDRRYETPSLPLAVALIANSSIQDSMLRYGEVTYSRASSLVQTVYRRFLEDLPRGISAGSSLSGSIEPVLAPSGPDSLVARALSSRAAFDSGPKGEHPDPIDMSFGESEWRAPVRIGPTLVEALRRPRAELEAGARLAVSRYLSESRGVTFAPEEIVLGAGVHPLVGSAIRGIGEVESKPVQVSLPQPSYGMFFPTIEIAGARSMEFATAQQDRFKAHVGMLPFHNGGRGASSRGINALLLNEPSNPAGQYYTAEQWRALAEAVRAAHGYLLFDDVFGMLDFGRVRGRRPPSMQVLDRELGPRLVSFGGVSKEFAAGGLRFGFAATMNRALAEAMRGNLLAIPDSLALAAAPEYLSRWQELIQPHRFYLSSKAMGLETVFRERNLPVTEVQGGYAMFVNLAPVYGRRLRLTGGGHAEITPQNLHNLLYTEAGIRVRSDQSERVSGHYRFVFSIERIEEAVQRLKLFFRAAR